MNKNNFFKIIMWMSLSTSMILTTNDSWAAAGSSEFTHHDSREGVARILLDDFGNISYPEWNKLNTASILIIQNNSDYGVHDISHIFEKIAKHNPQHAIHFPNIREIRFEGGGFSLTERTQIETFSLAYVCPNIEIARGLNMVGGGAIVSNFPDLKILEVRVNLQAFPDGLKALPQLIKDKNIDIILAIVLNDSRPFMDKTLTPILRTLKVGSIKFVVETRREMIDSCAEAIRLIGGPRNPNIPFDLSDLPHDIRAGVERRMLP